MCDKAILENGGTSTSVPDYYKKQETSHEAVDNYPNALEFPECYKIRNCLIKLLILILLQYSVFQNVM